MKKMNILAAILLSTVLLFSAFSRVLTEAEPVNKLVLSTVSQIKKAFPKSYFPKILALKEAHPNWNFIAFDTGLTWEEIFDDEAECTPQRNLVYYTPDKTSPFYKPSSWYSTTIPGSYNWAANGWTPFDSGEWFQASREAMEYCIDPRNFFDEKQIFQFLDSTSSIDEEDALKAISYMIEANAVEFWMQDGEAANLFDSVEYIDNPEYAPWVEAHTPEPVVYGDVNGDGEWDVFDIAVIGSYILEMRELDEDTFEAADINGDGEVDVFDIAVLGSYILGNREEVPQREQRQIDMTGAPPEKLPVYHWISYPEAIEQTARAVGVNQLTAAGRVLQEHSSAHSELISGTRAFTLEDGTVIDGGYYNYYSIGAFGNTLDAIYESGLREAYDGKWDTRYKSLAGGVKKYFRSFIQRGQTTLYSQKFLLDASSDRVFWGQYMQNLTAPQSEASRLYNAYAECGILDSDLTFIIPVIHDMPAETYYPTKDGNPNYKMAYIWAVSRADVLSGEKTIEELSAENYIQSFNTDQLYYEFTVPYDCENLQLFTAAYAPTSTITLFNDYEEDPGPLDVCTGSSSSYYLLAQGMNTITVTCTAENGDERVYVLTVTREDPPPEETEVSEEDSSEEIPGENLEEEIPEESITEEQPSGENTP